MKTFRLLSYLLVAVLSFSFVSCSDDDDDVSYSTSILGTWQISHSKGSEVYNGNEYTWDDAEDEDFWVFNSDGTGYNYYSNETGKYYFDWSIKGDVMTFQGDIDMDKCIIKQLTSDKLVVFHTWSSVEYEGEGECTDTYRRIK
ncbi:lipocalin family protein [Bacteroides sp. 51]|uniref:lipocalin family protein n=1 Tax=Bacteroides sp. 51 TaxID=2302938 RepID=UPI0013D2C630|nr:lipocalin family protein [Bacteroides sp. 51]NDV84108.1 hypothetical protein [Bacteroides sp. 51]